MTRDEIVLALRCCAEGECHGCTIYNDKQSCQERVLGAAADLIENQQRHIEALMQANDSLKDAIARRDKQLEDMNQGMAQLAKAVAVKEENSVEDTGLTPEEVSALIKDWSDLRTIVGEYGGIDRLRELAEADKDERCVVLPCKVGDTVWITGSVRRLYSEKVRTFFCGDPSYSRGMADNGVKMIRTTGCDIPIHEFGKTVFLTREEAEKALEEMKNE